MNLVDLVNSALYQVGETRIETLDPAAGLKEQTCNSESEIAIRQMLSEAQWHFAHTRVLLAADATPPVAGTTFTFQYTLPGDNIRVWGIGDDGEGNPDEDYAWETGRGEDGNLKLFTTRASPLMLHYTPYIDDPNKWPIAQAAVRALLAASFAGAFAHDATLARAKLQEYHQILLPNAMAVDAQQATVKTFHVTELLDVRNG